MQRSWPLLVALLSMPAAAGIPGLDVLAGRSIEGDRWGLALYKVLAERGSCEAIRTPDAWSTGRARCSALIEDGTGLNGRRPYFVVADFAELEPPRGPVKLVVHRVTKISRSGAAPDGEEIRLEEARLVELDSEGRVTRAEKTWSAFGRPDCASCAGLSRKEPLRGFDAHDEVDRALRLIRAHVRFGRPSAR